MLGHLVLGKLSQRHNSDASWCFLLQNSTKMPEVRDLSDALPEMPMDPITGVGVVASRNRAPTGYDVVSHMIGPEGDQMFV